MFVNLAQFGKKENPKEMGVLSYKLPIKSFTPFETRRLKNTELVWVNQSLLKEYGFNDGTEEIEKRLLDKYSYVSKDYANKSRIISGDCKLFWADRYGSKHEVCNGGSARCGFDGHFQVKGIGLTPLLAQNISKSHSHGKLFLDEAISEAVWGEICHKNLPFGAIRTLAIIKTNVNEEFSYLKDKPQKPCALAIREFAVRPAHFERATFFWPSKEYMTLRDNDALRVRESIKSLPNILDKSNNEKYASKKKLKDCVFFIIKRIAKQVAYSRVKGIPHGSLTSSNISIDGKFLDFGTITAVPDFGNYVLADGVGAIWDDHLLIGNWLKNLMVTINKYSEFDEVFSIFDINNLIQKFFNEIDMQENIAILNELDVKEVNNVNISLSKEIKNELLSHNRQTLGDFQTNLFKEKIASLAVLKGLRIGQPKFLLRDFKYSSFYILNNESLIKGKYSKKSITNLINKYC
ncbi:TPA: YdiU family protein [Vibrio harveyi]|nr:YdiU family protein [Vibrio harveyi]